MLAERTNNLGTESAFSVLARANALGAQGHDVINLGIGQPDFATPTNVVEAAVKALKDGHHGYTPANGLPALREAVAADIAARRGVEVSPDQIVCVPGGKVTMTFAMLMFGEPGAEILYPDPGFPIYESMIRFSGATPVPVALDEARGFTFSAEAVLGQITERSRLLIINSPANPTGGVVDKDELDKLVAGLERWPNLAILSDEIYSRMLYDGERHTSLLEYPSIRDRVIVLDGWSKTYAMTGWRLGWGLYPKRWVDLATRLCINSHSCVNASAQFAGIEALTGPQAAVDEMMRAFDARRSRIFELANALPGVRCQLPKGAFYAFPNISNTGWLAAELQDRLLEEAHVATIAGTSFGANGEGFIRLSYANSLENIERAMERIGSVLKGA